MMTVSKEAITQMGKAAAKVDQELQLLLLSIRSLSPSDRRKLLFETQTILDNFDEFSVKYFEQWTPYHYIGGSNNAIEDMLSMKLSVSQKAITTLDQEAMQLIASDAVDNMRDAITVLNKSTSRIINDATRADIEQRIASFVPKKDRKEIVDMVKTSLQEDGLYVLRDRGGKRWSLDAYSEMLTRTELANASREGRGNRYVQNGQDLVQIDEYGSTHEECRVWEGKVVSLTGATPGFPTLDDAISAGLMHPNCKHNYTAYDSELAAL
jgi:hypothetical protein